MYLIKPNSIDFVKGFTVTMILDPYRNDFDFIPNEVYNYLNKYNFIIDTTCSSYLYYEDYLNFLVSKDYLLLLNDYLGFLENSKNYENTVFISNAIIEISNIITLSEYINLFFELKILGCLEYEIRIFDFKVDVDFLINILSNISGNYIGLYLFIDKKL